MTRKKVSIGRLVLWGISLTVLFYLCCHVFVIIPISFSSSEYLEFPPKGFSLKWYRNYFSSPGWTTPTILSMQLATVVMVISTIIGTLAALGATRRKFPGKTIFQILMLSPMIIPIIIISIAIYNYLAKMHLIGNFWGMVIGHLIVAVPFVFINVSATFQGFDITLEKASYSLGANRLKTFFLVTFPLIRPGIFTGALFAFIISFDELIITMFVAGIRYTLPVRMWQDLRLEINPTIATISTFFIILSIAALLSAEWIRRRAEKRYHYPAA